MNRLLYFSIFLCMGGIMCNPKDAKPAGDATANGQDRAESAALGSAAQTSSDTQDSSALRRMQFEVGENTLYLLKIADNEHQPRGSYHGKIEFERAIQGASREVFLVYIVMPSGIRDVTVKHVVGRKETQLPEPRLVFRMPNSPRYTFAIVEAGEPGQIEGVMRGGISGKMDLADKTEALKRLPLHWDDKAAGSISYQGLPASLYGKMPN